MASFTKLPSGNVRAVVRRRGIYKSGTFPTKREAKDWATQIEANVSQVSAVGFAQPPKGATLSDLIDSYVEQNVKTAGRTKAASLAMLKREIGRTNLTMLNSIVLRDFIDRRAKDGAGGVTIAADLSFLSAVISWARLARRMDLPERLALDARSSLKYRGLRTRSKERDREPTDDELHQLYEYWAANPRQRIDMVTLCKMALSTGMRLGEICGLQAEDVDKDKRTVVIRDRKDPQKKQGNDQSVPLLPAAWALVEPRLRDEATGYIFPYQAKSASTAFTRACEALGIEDLHFHDLRHRATAQLFRMGLDIPRVALMTGHKTWSMLRRYTLMKPADVQDAVAQHALSRKRNGEAALTR